MQIEPLRGKLLVRRITLPNITEEKPQRGEIVCVGYLESFSNSELRYVQVEKGDTIIFANYTGVEIMVDGIKHLIMDESDILAVIRD